jgi:hypothetical protein
MSNNLTLTQVATNQTNPEVPVNDKGGELDAALTETSTLDLTNSLTCPTLTYQRAIRLLITPTGVAKTLTLPAVKRLLVLQNAGTNAVTIAVGTTNFLLAAAAQTFVYTDGTTNGLQQLSLGGGGGGGSTAQPCDIATFIPGKPVGAATVFRFNVLRAFTWPIALAGSVFNAAVAATGTSVFTILQNGSSIGTLSFAAAGTVPTITFTSAVTFAANDVISITAPAVQDATLADIAFDFLGSRPIGTTLQPFDIGVFIAGKPGAAATVLRLNVVREFVWKASLTGSVCNAGVASAASKVFTIKNNGSSIGTVTFSTSSTGTIAFAADVFFAVGDVLTIEAPAVQDTTLADVALNFLGSR